MQQGSAAPAKSSQNPERPKRVGWLGRTLWPLFRHVRLDDEAAQRLTDAYAKGVVVHVFRASRLTDPLFLLYALAKYGLPTPEWMHDHYASREENSLQALRDTVEAGKGAVLFLRRPRTLLAASGTYTEHHVETLLSIQRQTKRPILLLPETLHWTTRPVGLRPTLIDSVFGNRDAPGRYREVAGFLWNYGNARFHVGVPVDLASVLEREAGSTDRITARKIRWAIAHHLSREEQLRTGPRLRSMTRTRQMVLNDPSVRRFFEAQVSKGKKLEVLERKAQTLLKGMAADMRHGWLRVLDVAIDKLWRRIYDGIVVDQEGLAKVRRAARRGPVVLVPSHKSHIDYIVLSQVFFKDGLMPPLVAAGENLNFWPAGYIFRRSGAFFIRRSFKDKLYAVVFAAYVRRLLKEGHALEFFIEGGRSRTGKLLPPRTGLLSMCVDPVLDGRIADVAFIPVSISYEKIVEAGAYAKELAGAEKQKEDARGLLSSAKLLRSRYGRVYVDFAEPVSLQAFRQRRGPDPKDATHEERAPTDDQAVPGRAQLIVQLGHRIVNGINEVTRATPTSVAALVLLAQPLRGLGEKELYQRADWLIRFLETLRARISTTLTDDAEDTSNGPRAGGLTTRHAAIREAMGRFAAEGKLKMITAPDGETVYQLDDTGRQTLDYYKNNILHFVVPSAIVALATVAQPTLPADREQVSATALRLSRLLKNEFSFRVDAAFEENFLQASEALSAHRVLTIDDDGRWNLTTDSLPIAREFAGLLAPFLEAYRLTAQTLDQVADKSMGARKFVALALAAGRRRAMDGRLVRAEAAMMPSIKTSLAVLRAEGVIGASGSVKLEDRDRRDALVAELTSYLRATAGPDST